jgi:hypothetical protein
MSCTIVAGGVFAYIFQIFMMQKLPGTEFLAFQRYLSSTNIIGSIFAGITIYMSNKAS